MNSITTSNLFNRLNRFAIGYEPLFREFEKRWDITQPSYPPYNMIKLDDDSIKLEIAVAGFSKDEVVIEQKADQLFVCGQKEKAPEGDTTEYIHKGLSSRSFKLNWSLADHVEVKEATMEDGILTVELQRVIPEEEKPKVIEIK